MTRNPPAVDDVRAGWRALLALRFERRGERTIGVPEHEGPLRVLKSLYPEGDAVCHEVIVHPPGGIVGGDELGIDVDVGDGAHAVLTTPGATRFYRSAGRDASQSLRAVVREGARLEWLPQETIVHHGGRAANRMVFDLAPGASMIGWDIVCLGLPAAGETFAAGSRLAQHLEIEGRWLERGCIDGGDTKLLHSPLGLAGNPVFATAWVAWSAPERLDGELDALMWEAARGAVGSAGVGRSDAAPAIAVTRLQPGLVVARALAQRAEPVWTAWRALRTAWRSTLWAVPPCEPRVWRG